MLKTIPLRANVPNLRFSVAMGDYSLEFTFHWVARFEYFRVDIRDVTNDPFVLTNGRIAHPDVDLLNGLDDSYGRVYIVGDVPTLKNLGDTAVLKWEEPVRA